MRPCLFAVLLVAFPKNAHASPTSDPERSLSLFAYDQELGPHEAFAGHAIGSARGSLSLALLGGISRWVGFDGVSVRWHVGVEVSVPLDRIARGDRTRAPRAPHGWPSLGEDSMKNNSKWLGRSAAAWLVPLGLTVAVSASGKDPPKGASPPTSVSTPSVPSVVPSPPASVSASIAAPEPPQSATIRQLIVAAWRVAGLDREEVAADLASRARTSALVPHLQVRVHRGVNGGSRVYSYDTGDHFSTLDSTQTLVEARLSWRLDRLVFADEEVSIERLKLDRAELKQKVASRVIDLTLRWQRARRAAADSDRLPVEREEAALVATEALLALDAYTDGAATKLLPR